ncbi:MAG: 30S ribosomal protein S12 methylthiotransferase RimO [Anaerolineaceae bacterium]|nr:MAG: 30S ribosomal protein S12 methylthiotransferase RimO [Anaerolineaceae bacterium]
MKPLAQLPHLPQRLVVDMQGAQFYFLSLGCAKNTVDSQSMAALLSRAGYVVTEHPEQADILVVNTCGFIEPAREESYTELRRLADGKSSNQVLIAAGCLTERYGRQVVRQVPGIDGLLGTRRWMDILQVVRRLHDGNEPRPLYHLPESEILKTEPSGMSRIAVQGPSAYLKIADGCRRPCAFCAIPLIKGTAVSRPPEAILEDARLLQERGVREINLIAQDTSDYGHDLGIEDGLSMLLEDLVKAAPAIDWIRILYTYPGSVTERLINIMAYHPQIVPYLDIPLQHGHPDVLRRMRRPANIEWVYRTIDKMRAVIPDLALRTTFIVGYPGETEEEFQALLKFVEELRFDRVGVFTFSFEPGTSSESLGDPIPPEIKEERRGRLMELQQRISLETNLALIGQRLEVLIEGHGDGISLGRSTRDAPEIDGMVIVEGEIPVGEMVPIQITGAMPYDLTGVQLKNS